MKSLLVHGCYDRETLKTLLDSGAQKFAFDLRARSPNLIPFGVLESLLLELKDKEVTLVFENDLASTVHSFCDILKDRPIKFLLEFRDRREAEYYASLKKPFSWMFHPEAEWREILALPLLTGVILPTVFSEEVRHFPELWRIIEYRKLDICLHAQNFEEAAMLLGHDDVSVSIDLSKEIEIGFRSVDQVRLKNLSLWSRLNESSLIK